MYKALKIELKLTNEQKIQINKTIGTERFIYNEYIKYNQEQYKLGNKFVSANDFSKYLNNIYLPSNPDKKWIKEVSICYLSYSTLGIYPYSFTLTNFSVGIFILCL